MPSPVSLLAGFALSAVLGWAATALAVPRLRGLSSRQHVREDVPATHLAKAGTPSMGGIPMLAAIILGAVATGLATGTLTPRLLACLGVAVVFSLVGLADDVRKLGDRKSKGILARYRVGVEVLAALLFVAGLPGPAEATSGAAWLGATDWPRPLAAALGALVIVGAGNAVNLTDGLDGLASGLAAIAGVALGVAAVALGRGDVAVLALAIAGGAAGFLTHNAKPARVWMGDVGSLGLGACLATAAVAGRMEFLFAVVGAVFVAEALSVILQVISFQTTGKRIFRMSPLHHHFELGGMSEVQVVWRFWLAGACAAAVGLGLLWLTMPAS